MLQYKDEVLLVSLKSVCGHNVSKHLKEHSAVVVKKEFQLGRLLSSLKMFTK